ncbi:MAG TPA: cytochrome c biogenesis protein ResB [Opitutaceae bacterium]|nr:cytochrome c biogenesis protein ResB [Opitutaceae bacterium]HRJ45990.1 cytochrome c biogenesis protein ResB [Opitutaceae bacterium]
MREPWKSFHDFFVSLKLTVVLMALSIVLVFWATLAQVQLGIWAVQEKFFRTFFVLEHIPNTDIPVPVFPGGYFIGGLLLINLVVAHISRFKLTWRKSGIFLTHLGLIVLLLGELFTGLWQEEYQMRLDEGETKNYSESYRFNELAIIETTDPEFDDVVVIPEKLLARGAEVQHPRLPFRVVPRLYYPNAALQLREAGQPANTPVPVNRDIGTRLQTIPLPLTYKLNERNLPTAFIELIGPDGSLGTWQVSPQLLQPQAFTYAGRQWRIALRFERHYKPYALTLLKFSHDRYAGTDIPKNFSSRVRLTTPDGADDREILIFMNNPLRYGGLTFYQAGFDNNDRTTILQIVRNPSWTLPYIACALMSVGLLAQFCISLAGFIDKRVIKTAAKS